MPHQDSWNRDQMSVAPMTKPRAHRAERHLAPYRAERQSHCPGAHRLPIETRLYSFGEIAQSAEPKRVQPAVSRSARLQASMIW